MQFSQEIKGVIGVSAVKIRAVKKQFPSLKGRSEPQIRTKINNLKMGKDKCKNKCKK